MSAQMATALLLLLWLPPAFAEYTEFWGVRSNAINSTNCLFNGECAWLIRDYYRDIAAVNGVKTQVRMDLTRQFICGSDWKTIVCQQFSAPSTKIYGDIYRSGISQEFPLISNRSDINFLALECPATGGNLYSEPNITISLMEASVILEHPCACQINHNSTVCRSIHKRPDPPVDFLEKVSVCEGDGHLHLQISFFVAVVTIIVIFLVDIGFYTFWLRKNHLPYSFSHRILSRPPLLLHFAEAKVAWTVALSFGATALWAMDSAFQLFQDSSSGVFLQQYMVVSLPPLLLSSKKYPFVGNPVMVLYCVFVLFEFGKNLECNALQGSSYSFVAILFYFFIWLALLAIFLFRFIDEIKKVRKGKVDNLHEYQAHVQSLFEIRRKTISSSKENLESEKTKLEVTDRLKLYNVRLLSIQVFCACAILLTCTRWVQFCHFFGLLFESLGSNYRCCNGVVCEDSQASEWGVYIFFNLSCSQLQAGAITIEIILTLSGVIPGLIILHGLYQIKRNHDKQVRETQKGNLPFAVKRPKPNSSLAKLIKYAGFQIASCLLGWLTATILLSLIFTAIMVLFISAFEYVLPKSLAYSVFKKTLYDADKREVGFLGVAILNYFLVLLFVRLLFLQSKKSLAVKNKFMLSFVEAIQFLLAIPNGVISFVTRLIICLAANLLFIFRLDVPVVPKGMEGLDIGYSSFAAFVNVSAFYSNPVLHVFIDLSTKHLKNKRMERFGHTNYEDNVPLEADDYIPISKPISRNAKRWLVAYTLVRNPSLRTERRPKGMNWNNVINMNENFDIDT
eukprot:m.344316 g.344316  ORF g.344316 m.344316 type:complete len:792 (-) comp24170_c0_seq1:963-3338(-)